MVIGVKGNFVYNETMANIESYLEVQSHRLREDFERIRANYTDSDAKGSANEKVVAEFLQKHISAEFVVTNAEIIDSYGEASSEVDICVCNRDQPFNPSPSQILLAEGVDFVVQVKAYLTSGEIDRVIGNCDGVKKLRRKASKGDFTLAKVEDIPYYLDRIPYIVLAFSSALKLETVLEKLIEKLKDVALEHQPDAIFILNTGTIWNFREGKGKTWKSKGKPIAGLCAAYSGEQTLLEFMRFIHVFVPRFHRTVSPLVHYFPDKLAFRLIGRTQ